MPRVTVVKRAQQRYATKPVLNEDGTQKQVPMVSSRTGEQKVTKSGRPVFLKITERDLTQPLPMPQCDYPGCTDREIKVGSSYKWIEPSGSAVRNRHAEHPSWNVWEYSSSLSARIAQIQDGRPDAELFESKDDAEAWAQEKADEITELADEKRESQQNMEDGFGHATGQSDELGETADSLDEWAEALTGCDLPDYPEPEEEPCETCDGTGEQQVLNDAGNLVEEGGDVVTETCRECDGSGQVTPDEPTDEQVDEWRAAVLEALESALDECSL